MCYVIEVTCIGPRIRECFSKKELAVRYVTVLRENYPDKHFQVAVVDLELV